MERWILEGRTSYEVRDLLFRKLGVMVTAPTIRYHIGKLVSQGKLPGSLSPNPTLDPDDLMPDPDTGLTSDFKKQMAQKDAQARFAANDALEMRSRAVVAIAQQQIVEIPKDLECLNGSREFLADLRDGWVFWKDEKTKKVERKRLEDVVTDPAKALEQRRKAAIELVKVVEVRNELTGGKPLTTSEEGSRQRFGARIGQVAREKFGELVPLRGHVGGPATGGVADSGPVEGE